MNVRLSTAPTPRAARGAGRAGFRLTAVVLLGLGATIGYLCLLYFSGDPRAKRFQIETATLWFVILGLALTFFRNAETRDRSVEERRSSLHEAVLWILGAVALYWPAFTIGLLSDDFLLTERAFRFAFGAFNAEAFRPLPLAIWSVILHAGGNPIILHGLNIVLHGFNAFLTARIVEPLIRSRTAAVLAGATVLTMPVAIEPVVWCSGVFDITATTFVLLAVLAGRGYERVGGGARVRLIACCVAGLLSKETAVAAPFFVAGDAWLRGIRSRSLYRDLAVLLCGVAVVGAVRLTFASATVKQPLSKYMFQRWLFGTVSGLATPWHADVIGRYPWIPIVVAWLLIALFAQFVFRTVNRRGRQLFCAMSAWALVGTAPALTFFFVAPDLQNSRYLYLSTVGWAGLLATMGRAESRRLDSVLSGAAVVVLISFGVWGVRQHLQPWRDAAAARDTFERAASQNAVLLACQTITIRNPPDAVNGAYVLRNGAIEALRRDIAFRGEPGGSSPACSFTWDPAIRRFRSAVR